MAFLENMFPHPGPPPEKMMSDEEHALLKCEHVRFRYVRRTLRNGALRFGLQCMGCGQPEAKSWLGEKQAAEVYQCSPSDWQEFDDQFTQDAYERRMQLYTTVRERHKKRHSEAWWDWYSAYLRSGAWQKRRSRILQRDNYSCGGCGAAAHEVHHLTYQRVGYEDDRDLISVCVSCHKKIHGE